MPQFHARSRFDSPAAALIQSLQSPSSPKIQIHSFRRWSFWGFRAQGRGFEAPGPLYGAGQYITTWRCSSSATWLRAVSPNLGTGSTLLMQTNMKPGVFARPVRETTYMHFHVCAERSVWLSGRAPANFFEKKSSRLVLHCWQWTDKAKL